MAVQHFDFIVKGDPATARNTAQQALAARHFTVTWHDPWTGTAERGSKVANVLAGAFAQYFKVGLRVMSTQQDETIVRIERQSSGWMGGAIGASQTSKNLASLRDELEGAFRQAGVLSRVTEG